MIITLFYLYLTTIIDKFPFEWKYGFVAFIMDLIFINVIRSSKHTIVKENPDEDED